ncbi:MAG TPA: hypothetical protein PKJ41_08215 [Bryobacteraceae bacterium]|nr:hypothetical protein [Bryobacteraceae bacterium]HPT25654.1 hypothetical protein [Bryobacteraceae bacterium]
MSEQISQHVGLDIGTSRVVAARKNEEAESIESQLNAFVRLPHSKMTEASLGRENVPFSISDGHILVYGNESAALADLLGQEVRRPMTQGFLNSAEPASLEQIEEILSSVLTPGEGEDLSKTRICFSVPAAPSGNQESLTYHEATVRQVLEKLGYSDIRSINEGVAAVYAELEETNYTGIGVSCGGGLCNVALAYMSVPVMTFSIAKGGDFIDTSAAAVTGEMANRIRLVKEETFHFNGHYSDKVQQALTVYYDDMIQSVVQGLNDALRGSRQVPKMSRRVPLVLSGGGAMPEGFKARFERALQAANLPVPVSEVRLAKEPLHTTARGALVAALSE